MVGSLPHSHAIIRNIAITVQRVQGTTNMAASVRCVRAHVAEALRYLGLPVPDF